MKQIRVHSLKETNALAQKVASLLTTPALITLSGDLGAGKTTFTKGLAKGLKIEDTVTSPTFTILKSYEGEDVTLHHMDAYRLEGIVQDLGFEEEIYDEDAVCVIEWSHFIEYALPKERLEIKITIEGEDRIFTLHAIGKKYEEIVEAI